MFTPLLRGDHQGFGGLPPALAGLGGDAEHVDHLGLQARHHVLPGAGVQHVHRRRVAVGRVQAVRDLIGWWGGKGRETEREREREM